MHTRFVRPLIFVVVLLCMLGHPADGRIVRRWTDKELIDQADLVVIATPVRTHDTEEHLASFSYFREQPVIGVETIFMVSNVLKGDPKVKRLVLHHYRPDKLVVINGPLFVVFQIPTKQAYRLFLVRDAGGRYAPVAGQEDADLSIRKDSGE